MLSIGTFAQMAGCSIRTLHHYGELGLLEPHHTEPSSGYRYYHAAQLADINRILALRDLGFGLPQITQLLRTSVTVEDLKAMLLLREAEAAQHVAQETQRLARVQARIRNLERHPMNVDVVIKSVEAARCAIYIAYAPDFFDSLTPVHAASWPIINGELGRLGVKQVAPEITLYHDNPGDGEDRAIKVTFAIPIGDAEFDSDVLTIDQIPGMQRAATAIHRGSPATFDQTYDAMTQWAIDADETILGYSREVYIDCCGPLDQWVTEFQFELEPK